MVRAWGPNLGDSRGDGAIEFVIRDVFGGMGYMNSDFMIHGQFLVIFIYNVSRGLLPIRSER